MKTPLISSRIGCEGLSIARAEQERLNDLYLKEHPKNLNIAKIFSTIDHDLGCPQAYLDIAELLAEM